MNISRPADTRLGLWEAAVCWPAASASQLLAAAVSVATLSRASGSAGTATVFLHRVSGDTVCTLTFLTPTSCPFLAGLAPPLVAASSRLLDCLSPLRRGGCGCVVSPAASALLPLLPLSLEQPLAFGGSTARTVLAWLLWAFPELGFWGGAR